ncbi:dentin sialophosphoprotein-like [Liolophura sinensis]|uniref:dentin sialophosphoprotein-like n=1 Tax=Liolophura sinensis TaxID=3198878 RepID=UPI0031591D8C
MDGQADTKKIPITAKGNQDDAGKASVTSSHLSVEQELREAEQLLKEIDQEEEKSAVNSKVSSDSHENGSADAATLKFKYLDNVDYILDSDLDTARSEVLDPEIVVDNKGNRASPSKSKRKPKTVTFDEIPHVQELQYFPEELLSPETSDAEDAQYGEGDFEGDSLDDLEAEILLDAAQKPDSDSSPVSSGGNDDKSVTVDGIVDKEGLDQLEEELFNSFALKQSDGSEASQSSDMDREINLVQNGSNSNANLSELKVRTKCLKQDLDTLELQEEVPNDQNDQTLSYEHPLNYGDLSPRGQDVFDPSSEDLSLTMKMILQSENLEPPVFTEDSRDVKDDEPASSQDTSENRSNCSNGQIQAHIETPPVNLVDVIQTDEKCLEQKGTDHTASDNKSGESRENIKTSQDSETDSIGKTTEVPASRVDQNETLETANLKEENTYPSEFQAEEKSNSVPETVPEANTTTNASDDISDVQKAQNPDSNKDECSVVAEVEGNSTEAETSSQLDNSASQDNDKISSELKGHFSVHEPMESEKDAVLLNKEDCEAVVSEKMVASDQACPSDSDENGADTDENMAAPDKERSESSDDTRTGSQVIPEPLPQDLKIHSSEASLSEDALKNMTPTDTSTTQDAAIAQDITQGSSYGLADLSSDSGDGTENQVSQEIFTDRTLTDPTDDETSFIAAESDFSPSGEGSVDADPAAKETTFQQSSLEDDESGSKKTELLPPESDSACEKPGVEVTERQTLAEQADMHLKDAITEMPEQNQLETVESEAAPKSMVEQPPEVKQAEGENKQEAEIKQAGTENKQEAEIKQAEAENKQEAEIKQAEGENKQEAEIKQAEGENKQEAEIKQAEGENKQEAEIKQAGAENKQGETEMIHSETHKGMHLVKTMHLEADNRQHESDETESSMSKLETSQEKGIAQSETKETASDLDLKNPSEASPKSMVEQPPEVKADIKQAEGENKQEAEIKQAEGENKQEAEIKQAEAENKQEAEIKQAEAENKQEAEIKQAEGENKQKAEIKQAGAENKQEAEIKQAEAENKQGETETIHSETDKGMPIAETMQLEAENRQHELDERESSMSKSETSQEKEIAQSETKEMASDLEPKKIEATSMSDYTQSTELEKSEIVAEPFAIIVAVEPSMSDISLAQTVESDVNVSSQSGTKGESLAEVEQGGVQSNTSSEAEGLALTVKREAQAEDTSFSGAEKVKPGSNSPEGTKGVRPRLVNFSNISKMEQAEVSSPKIVVTPPQMEGKASEGMVYEAETEMVVSAGVETKTPEMEKTELVSAPDSIQSSMGESIKDSDEKFAYMDVTEADTETAPPEVVIPQGTDLAELVPTELVQAEVVYTVPTYTSEPVPLRRYGSSVHSKPAVAVIMPVEFKEEVMQPIKLIEEIQTDVCERSRNEEQRETQDICLVTPELANAHMIEPEMPAETGGETNSKQESGAENSKQEMLQGKEITASRTENGQQMKELTLAQDEVNSQEQDTDVVQAEASEVDHRQTETTESSEVTQVAAEQKLVTSQTGDETEPLEAKTLHDTTDVVHDLRITKEEAEISETKNDSVILEADPAPPGEGVMDSGMLTQLEHETGDATEETAAAAADLKTVAGPLGLDVTENSEILERVAESCETAHCALEKQPSVSGFVSGLPSSSAQAETEDVTKTSGKGNKLEKKPGDNPLHDACGLVEGQASGSAHAETTGNTNSAAGNQETVVTETHAAETSGKGKRLEKKSSDNTLPDVYGFITSQPSTSQTPDQVRVTGNSGSSTEAASSPVPSTERSANVEGIYRHTALQPSTSSDQVTEEMLEKLSKEIVDEVLERSKGAIMKTAANNQEMATKSSSFEDIRDVLNSSKDSGNSTCSALETAQESS